MSARHGVRVCVCVRLISGSVAVVLCAMSMYVKPGVVPVLGRTTTRRGIPVFRPRRTLAIKGQRVHVPRQAGLEHSGTLICPVAADMCVLVSAQAQTAHTPIGCWSRRKQQKAMNLIADARIN